MTIPRDLSNLAPGANTSGVLQPSKGGTGLTSPGASGNLLTSNGTSWVSQALSAAPTQQIFTFTALTGTFARGATKAGTYSQTGTTVTVTFTAHGFIAGDRVYLDFTTGTAGDAWFTIATAATNTFTVTRTSASTSGNVTIYPPVVVTVNNHGQSTGASVLVDYSATLADGVETIYQATTNTFQTQGGTTTAGTGTSGNVTLPQVGTSQTWTRPTNCKKIFVQLVGGGGGTSGQAGAAGGYSQKFIDVTSISNASVTIGFAGSATYSTTTGGTTSFGSYLSATGGGTVVGGSGSNGDINYTGQGSVQMGGATAGGSTIFGTGGAAANSMTPSGYGVGASVGGCPTVTYNGTAGVVIVMEYY
jgi:hypothetical protein